MACISPRFSRLLVVSTWLALCALAQAAQPLHQGPGAGQTDALPQGALARMGTTRLRHGDGVCHVVYSPDCKYLASLSRDRTLRIWETDGYRQVHLIQETDVDFYGVAWSPDSKTIAAAGGDPFHGGRTSIRLFDAQSGELKQRLEGHKQPAYALAFAPDGRKLVSVGSQQVITWSLPAGQKLTEWTLGSTAALAFSADRKRLAWVDAESPDKAVHVCDAADGKEIQVLIGHAQAIVSLAYSPDGKYLASGNQHEPIMLWNTKTGKVAKKLEHQHAGLQLRFSADSMMLASAVTTGSAKIWNVETGAELGESTGYRGWVNCLAFTPDGKTLALAGADSQVIHLWDVAGGRPHPASNGHRGQIQTIAYSPDGKLLASASADWRDDDRAILIWNTATGNLVHRLMGHTDKVYSLQFSPDGSRLISGGEKEAMFRIWDVVGGTERPRWERRRTDGESERQEDSRVTAVAWSRDGKLIASGHDEGLVILWDAATGTELRRFAKGHDAIVNSLAFAPNGKWFVSGSVDRTVRIWDCQQGNQIMCLDDSSDTIRCVAVSPDGKIVAASVGDYDGLIRLWDFESGRELGRIQPTKARVHQIAFSPDGKLLAGTGPNNSLCLWEVASRLERCRFAGHPQGGLAIAFAPGGNALASGGQDTTILTWDVRFPGKTPPAVAEKDFDHLWTDLASRDGKVAHETICALLAEPALALKMIKQRLHSFSTMDASRMAQALDDLDHDRFPVREKATHDLAQLGELAEPFLRDRLENRPSAEVRRRVQLLLSRLDNTSIPPEHLRALRALEVLERIGGEQAHDVFAELAGQTPAGRVQREAQASLERLAIER
jgi:WD40 repeat protein